MNHATDRGPTTTRERTSSDHAEPAPVGVVIATRNRSASLAVTVRNLLALPERPQVLVVDNASTDDTPAMLAGDFPQVRVVSLPFNRGALARTHGVRALDTPYVAFSDDDSWWAPGALAAAARHFDAHPRLGLLSARTLVGPADDADPLNDLLADSPLGTATDLPGTQVLGFLGCAAVARRTAYLDAGGYHPLLFFGAEETLLAYDLAARGWGVTHCPDVLAHHHPDPGPRTGRPAVVLRNELLTAWLRRPLPYALARTRALAAEARRDPHARRALRETLTRLPAALRARRPLPPHVERAARLLDTVNGAAS
ncbi:glycosyltransferase family 2 protein [Streptomyces mutabilis]|uniref:glycosyltransferase family 2 protein n=1 Tax=Streptomyces TaxID=1883 RepID=UPI0025B256FC|nr:MULTISPECIES: glycosyltransferase [unclassified Streptomyces]MDN3247028.1 glycosyltransferase [Streptomyces sp. ZSW22]MDQ0384584.1 GT2 family glycosyltransferase [Streptomyces sp. DSM 42143]